MWLTNDVVAAVDRVARIEYIDVLACKAWNQHRKEGELRLLTGWYWSARGNPGYYQQGLKTKTMAYRDAWYVMVQRSKAPPVSLSVRRPGRLRIVS